MRKSKIKDNDFLLSLNFDQLSDEQKTAILAQVIDNELEKNEEEADQDLIEECLAYIEELNGGMFRKSDEDLDAGLIQIYAKVQQEKDTTNQFSGKKIRTLNRKKVFKITAVLVAAVFAAFASLTVIAKVNGYGSAADWVSAHISELFNLKPGEYEYDTDGITVIKGNETKKYSNIEEVVEKEKLDIMYPAVLPQDVKITHIYQTFYEGDNFDILFEFNSRSVGLTIYNYDLFEYAITNEQDIIESNGYQFGIFQASDGRYQANCITEKYAYSIKSDNYDDLITIIKNMKGS